jgi:hypothetical protein
MIISINKKPYRLQDVCSNIHIEVIIPYVKGINIQSDLVLIPYLIVREVARNDDSPQYVVSSSY